MILIGCQQNFWVINGVSTVFSSDSSVFFFLLPQFLCVSDCIYQFTDMTDGGDESILLWFAPDVPSYDGKLAFSKQKKIGISYHGPTGNEFPYGR